MSNAGAVSQLPITAKDAPADRMRGSGRNGPGDDKGSFMQLVSKLAHKDGGRGGEAPPSSGPGDGARSRLESWLRGAPDLLGSSAGDGEQKAAGSEDALALQSDPLSQLLLAAGVTSVASLMQMLSASGLFPANGDAAALAAKLANGTATETEAALVRSALAAIADGGTMPTDPDATIIAGLAKATSQAEARRAGTPPIQADAKVAVLGQEVHLAPVAAAGAMQAGNAAAGSANAGSGNGPQLPDLSSDTALAADKAAPAPGSMLASMHSAAAAVRDGRSGAHQQHRGSANDDTQAQPGASTADAAGPASQGAGVAPVDASAAADATSSVIRQIVERLNTEVVTLASDGRVASRGSAQLQPPGSPAKVIYIQLQPGDLGTVTIRMSVKDQALQLDLEVGRGETAHLIQRERDTLSALLRSAGYLIDGVDVRLAGPNAAHPPGMDGQAGSQMQGGGQSRGSQADGRPPGTGQQDDPRQSPFGNERNGDEERAGHTPGGGGLYI